MNYLLLGKSLLFGFNKMLFQVLMDIYSDGSLQKVQGHTAPHSHSQWLGSSHPSGQRVENGDVSAVCIW